jgi:hypothetical protein
MRHEDEMGRPRKHPEKDSNVVKEEPTMTAVMDTEIEKAVKVEQEKVEINDMPLTSLRDYRLRNEAAAAENKKLKLCRYKLIPCPISLHPTQRIVFGRVDQPSNPLNVFVSNSMIHFKKTLIPGQAYDLPQCIVSYLSEKGTPVWKWRDKADGSRETYFSHKEPRFALRTIYQD